MLDPTAARDPRRLEGRHPEAAAEEWTFTCWGQARTADHNHHVEVGIVSGYRVFGRQADTAAPRSWYWAALAGPGRPLLHVADWDVAPRPDPLLVKSAGLWAEHVCDAPMEQWTIANETYAAALDDPDEAVRRGYGTPTPVAWDLEWYATGPATERPDGYEQVGVVHGVVELAAGGRLDLDELPAHRWHRWGSVLDPIELPAAFAHTGVRAPFAFPDGSSSDWTLTPDGWRSL